MAIFVARWICRVLRKRQIQSLWDKLCRLAKFQDVDKVNNGFASRRATADGSNQGFEARHLSDRRLQVKLTQEAKIVSDFSFFRAIFAFAGFVSALKLCRLAKFPFATDFSIPQDLKNHRK